MRDEFFEFVGMCFKRNISSNSLILLRDSMNNTNSYSRVSSAIVAISGIGYSAIFSIKVTSRYKKKPVARLAFFTNPISIMRELCLAHTRRTADGLN